MGKRIRARIEAVLAASTDTAHVKAEVGRILRDELRAMNLPDKVVEGLILLYSGRSSLSSLVQLGVGAGLWNT